MMHFGVSVCEQEGRAGQKVMLHITVELIVAALSNCRAVYVRSCRHRNYRAARLHTWHAVGPIEEMVRICGRFNGTRGSHNALHMLVLCEQGRCITEWGVAGIARFLFTDPASPGNSARGLVQQNSDPSCVAVKWRGSERICAEGPALLLLLRCHDHAAAKKYLDGLVGSSASMTSWSCPWAAAASRWRLGTVEMLCEAHKLFRPWQCFPKQLAQQELQRSVCGIGRVVSTAAAEERQQSSGSGSSRHHQDTPASRHFQRPPN